MELTGQSDRDLVRKVRAGDRAAFDLLIERHIQRLRIYLGSRCRNMATVDEVSQEVWVKSYTRLETFDDERPFIAWLIGIARNQLAERSRNRQAMIFGGDALDALIDRSMLDEEGEDEDQRLLHLGECLGKMKERGRMLLIRHHGEGWPIKRLAQAYKLPAKRLAMQLLRLRKDLRNCVEQQA